MRNSQRVTPPQSSINGCVLHYVLFAIIFSALTNERLWIEMAGLVPKRLLLPPVVAMEVSTIGEGEAAATVAPFRPLVVEM